MAEVVVPGPESEAGGQAFSLLGGYIFGKNKGERKIEMTAPVVQTPFATPAASTKIEMTAPVVQTPVGNGANGFLVQFMMPSSYTLATLPEPLAKFHLFIQRFGQRGQRVGTWHHELYQKAVCPFTHRRLHHGSGHLYFG